MNYLFTSESVSDGHPDKLADQISDAILDNYLAFDQESKVACETVVTTGQVIIAGEVFSSGIPDHHKIIRDTIRKVGYTKEAYMFSAASCGILSALHSQSEHIRQGVVKTNAEEQGAGDQGMMFGYATNETDNLIPLTLDIAHKLVYELSELRKNTNLMSYLRPDSKSQVTIEYSEDHKPVRIDSIVVSTQHDEFITGGGNADIEMQTRIKADIIKYLIPAVKNKFSKQIQNLFDSNYTLHVNPTGSFIIGGPHGDTGLTGRKIIVDTYGGRGAHGGGAFSGKDPSKVDRSAAYAARHVAVNLVAAGICDEALVQISYAIGIAEPCGVYVNTNNSAKVKLSDGEISSIVKKIFKLTPFAINQRLKLKNPIYSETSSFGHVGREPKVVTKTFESSIGEKKTVDVELFTWEKRDFVEVLKKEFFSN